MLQKHTSILFNMWLEGNWKKLCTLWLKSRGSLMNTHYNSWQHRLAADPVTLWSISGKRPSPFCKSWFKHGGDCQGTLVDFHFFPVLLVLQLQQGMYHQSISIPLSVQKLFNMLLTVFHETMHMSIFQRGAWDHCVHFHILIKSCLQLLKFHCYSQSL